MVEPVKNQNYTVRYAEYKLLVDHVENVQAELNSVQSALQALRESGCLKYPYQEKEIHDLESDTQILNDLINKIFEGKSVLFQNYERRLDAMEKHIQTVETVIERHRQNTDRAMRDSNRVIWEVSAKMSMVTTLLIGALLVGLRIWSGKF